MLLCDKFDNSFISGFFSLDYFKKKFIMSPYIVGCEVALMHNHIYRYLKILTYFSISSLIVGRDVNYIIWL